MPGLYPGLAREAVERRQQRLSMGIQVGMARKLVSHWWVTGESGLIYTYIYIYMKRDVENLVLNSENGARLQLGFEW
jgi:hypothetical protein